MPTPVNPHAFLRVPIKPKKLEATPNPKFVKKSKYLWILDNGHGENTPGKRSPVMDDGKQLMEFEFNRAVVKEIIKRLTALNIDHHNLVPGLKDTSLTQRVKDANALAKASSKPCVYVSVHGNAASSNWSTANGIETFYFESSLKGRRLAGIFQEHLIETVGWRDRGVKTANFYVIKYTSMPAILTENGFFSNPDQVLKMLSPTWRKKIAEAHVKAILDIEQNTI